jgi:hypothetical protein
MLRPLVAAAAAGADGPAAAPPPHTAPQRRAANLDAPRARPRSLERCGCRPPSKHSTGPHVRSSARPGARRAAHGARPGLGARRARGAGRRSAGRRALIPRVMGELPRFVCSFDFPALLQHPPARWEPPPRVHFAFRPRWGAPKSRPTPVACLLAASAQAPRRCGGRPLRPGPVGPGLAGLKSSHRATGRNSRRRRPAGKDPIARITR